MKKFFYLIVLVSITYCSANAQLPEFSLHVKLFVNGDSARTVIFGYDPAASDSMLYGKETWFSNEFGGGEQLYFPAQTGDLDFRMSGFYVNRPELGIDNSDGGPIDIRKKPTADAFTLDYGVECHVVPGTTNAEMRWDMQSIPAIIKHVTLSSSFFPHVIRLDMKSINSFVIPLKDSGEDIYANMILRIYYNKEIDQSGVVAHTGIPTQEMTCYPNPMDSRSKLLFAVKQNCTLALAAYDITGKKVFERNIDAIEGENDMDLVKSQLSLHSGIYLLRFYGMLGGTPYTNSTTLIVR